MPCLAVLAVLAALLIAAPAAQADPAYAPISAQRGALNPNGHAQTCKHFDNRARFRDRGVSPDFLTRAADACAEALVAQREGRDALAATAVLERLTALRLTLRDMNRTRMFGETPDPRAFPLAAALGPLHAPGAAAGAQVSATGEYLIAREMGVLRVLDAWHRRRR